MKESEIQYIKHLLTGFSNMELISIHSFLRTTKQDSKIILSDIIDDGDLSDNLALSPQQLLVYVDMEFQIRNLN